MSAQKRLLRVAASAVILCAALGLLPAGHASALDLSEGIMRLTLHQGIGRFSLACVKDPGGAPIPLLAAQDPRTTTLSIVVGTKIYRMGESGDFSEAVQKTPLGGRFVWTSSFLSVTEDFSFVASPGSATADGVRIDITVRNASKENLKAGLRYLFDTYLGESGLVPFSTDRQPTIKRETTLAGKDLPAWWLSPLAGDAGPFGLQIMASAPGVTPPDRIVFANWKRLSDAAWSYDTSAARDFSLKPYSLNDSAVCQYYDPRALVPGGQFSATLVMGRFNPSGFSANAASLKASSNFASAVQQSLDAGKAARSAPAAIRSDIEALNAILARVDAALAAGGGATDDELALMESAITDLKARLAAYGSGK
ncbi:MAG TPA: hypothetical protein VMV03_10830 [Spirochaetia bacterium]|nr:hypothetical protein [Spirochaetia bacterium]